MQPPPHERMRRTLRNWHSEYMPASHREAPSMKWGQTLHALISHTRQDVLKGQKHIWSSSAVRLRRSRDAVEDFCGFVIKHFKYKSINARVFFVFLLHLNVAHSRRTREECKCGGCGAGTNMLVPKPAATHTYSAPLRGLSPSFLFAELWAR